MDLPASSVTSTTLLVRLQQSPSDQAVTSVDKAKSDIRKLVEAEVRDLEGVQQ